jgi:phosphoglycolate phosphatase-like HAD superfamily hydrolase
MHVLLFDIDGTLINTGGAGGAALRDAFRDAFGIPLLQDVPYSGRTDRAISRDMFVLHAVSDSDSNWARLQHEYLARLTDCLQRCCGRVLPGIAVLLDHLSRRDDMALGLLTGNLRDGARLKLEHYGLAHHFAFGGFGDDHFDRNQVAESALAAAVAHLDGLGTPQNIWVIGDTPLDIRCARWINARSLAVATGSHRRDELAAHQPDELLDDLSDVERVLSLLGPARK